LLTVLCIVSTFLPDLLPDDPNAIIGHALNMSCQLYYSDQYHARDLRFEFRIFYTFQHKRRTVRVPVRDLHVVNASLVELHYTNMRPRFDRSTVVCYHRNKPDTLSDMQIIKVGREWKLLFAIVRNFIVLEHFKNSYVFLVCYCSYVLYMPPMLLHYINLYLIKGALLCLFLFPASCARLSCILSFRVHVKLFYRIVSYRIV